MFDLDWQKAMLWASFVFFLGAALLRQEAAINQDLGRHLRLGEMIVEGGPPARFAGASARRVGEASETRKCALYSNCLTYTYPDYPFVNHHWGSEVIFYLVHKWTGFSGIIIFKAVILGLTLVITLLHSLEFNKGPAFLKRPGLLRLAVAVTLVFFSVQMMADRLTARPEIFGYLLFSMLFWLLNSSFPKRHFSLFLVSCSLLILLWVNLHISFIFGLVLIYLWSFSALIKKDPTILTVPAISTFVTLFNPSGLRGALMPLSILKDYGYTIVENMTPFFLSAFKPQPEYWIYSIILILAITLFLFSPAKKNLFHLLTFLTFSLFPLTAVRHLPFFALIIPPVLTPLIPDNGKFTKLPIIASSSLLIAALINPIPLAYGKLSPIGLTIDQRHNSAVEFVKQNNLKGSMWNNYDIGSFLEWAIPQHPTFVDGRPEAFPAGFFRQTYIPMQENKEVWDRAIAGYDIQWTFVALTDATPWFIKWWKMIQNHPDWRIVYIDNFSAVLVKINGKNNLVEPQGKAKLLETVNLD